MRLIRFRWAFCIVLGLMWTLLVAQSQAQEEPCESMSVVAEGVGESQEEALEMAFQGAIADAVGALVTAQTLIENGELVHDKIISHSGGFIEDYRILEGPESAGDGKIYLKIRANVAQTRLVSTLKENHVTVNEVSGTTLAAQSFSIDLSRRTGAEAWEALWNDFLNPSKIYKAELKSYKLIEAGDRSRVSFVYSINPDTDYFYDQVVPAISKLAKETCVFEIADPFEVKFDKTTYGPQDSEMLYYPLEDYSANRDPFGRMKFVKEIIKQVPLEFAKKEGRWQNRTNIVLLNERMDRSSLWKGYVLEAQVAETIEGLYLRDLNRIAVRFQFFDDESNEVAPAQYDLRFRLPPRGQIFTMDKRVHQYRGAGTWLEPPFGLGPGFVVNYTTVMDVNWAQAIGISPFIASRLAVARGTTPGLASEMEFVAELEFDTDLLQAVSKVSVDVVELSDDELTVLRWDEYNFPGFHSVPLVIKY